MRFDTKAAVLVRPDLAEWQQLNVTAFLASGLAGASDEVIGEPYEDGSGNRYLPLLREPVLCFAADRDGLAGAHRRALSPAGWRSPSTPTRCSPPETTRTTARPCGPSRRRSSVSPGWRSTVRGTRWTGR